MEFDWDEHNTKHLRAPRVSHHEFEEVLCGEPLDLEYEIEMARNGIKRWG